MSASAEHVVAGTFSLRPATAADDHFTLEIIAARRSTEPQFVRCTSDQQQAIVRFERDIQQQALAAVFPSATTSIIVVDGECAGRLIVNRDEDEVRLVDIELLPRFRGHGIGTDIVRGLCDEAAARGICVTLRVDVANTGARRLYERLGFRLLEFDWSYIEMEWLAN